MSSIVARFISRFNQFMKADNRTLLGRWTINDCHKTRNIKIDLSNEDHCGGCSQYRLKQIIKHKLLETRTTLK